MQAAENHAPERTDEQMTQDQVNPANHDVSARDLLRTAIQHRGILRGETQRLLAPNGVQQRWLLDLRQVLLQAETLAAAADLFWEICEDQLPFQVGGMEMAAVPLVTAILLRSVTRGTPVDGFIVRRERKRYGTGALIEGTLTNLPIVIVDDLLNSGRSLEKVRLALENADRRIARVFVLVDFLSSEGLTWRARNEVPVQAGFNLADFGLSATARLPETQLARFRTVWSFASPDANYFHRVPKSFPATDGQFVYFGSDCGIFWCLRVQDASIAWQFQVHTPHHKNLWSSPALHDGHVYFGSYDGNVYCLDSRTGAVTWSCDAADWVGSSPALAPELDLLFIGLEYAVEGKRGGVAALRLSTGEKVWEYPTKRYTHASPAYWPERRVVACGSNDDEMLLIDAETGTLRWRFQTRGDPQETGSIRHAPAFDTARSHVITGCADGFIYILDVETGVEVWSVKTEATIYTVPLVLEGFAFIGSTDKYFYVLDLEQKTVVARLFTGAKIYGPPRLLDGRVYFGTCSGDILELDPITLTISGRHQLPDAVTNALCYSVENQMFFALTYVNQLYAFTRESSDSKP